MNDINFYLGIDLGTSGVKIAIINSKEKLIYTSGINYPNELKAIEDWSDCCKELLNNIPIKIKDKIIALSIDGTSGTLIACNYQGKPIGEALVYNQIFYNGNILDKNGIDKDFLSKNSSISRANKLISKYGSNLLLRHQADWITGLFLNNWEWGEEGNNIKLGWDIKKGAWPKKLSKTNWINCLPKIVRSGAILGKIDPQKAKEFALSENLLIVAGTTDSTAAFLAAKPKEEEGITVLGSTIVTKIFVNNPLKGIGITNHRIGDKWICGGASNAGCSVLRKFFSDKEIKELSQQINPEFNSGINLLPLQCIGERFPENGPYLKPILEPRPISDSLYLHALLEGLSRKEKNCWDKLNELGAPRPKKIISIGGGAINQQWKKIRERTIGIPVKSCCLPPAMGVARIALESLKGKEVVHC